MTCKGIVRGNGVILEDGVTLPEGTAVEVVVLPNASLQSLTPEEKLKIVKDWATWNLPVSDWPQMEEEIIRGALQP